MNKNIIKILLPFVLAITSLSACNKKKPVTSSDDTYISETLSSDETESSSIEESSEESSSEEATSNETSKEDNPYYQGVSYTDGVSLAKSLQTLMFSTHTNWVSYGDLRQDLCESDKDPEGSGKIVCFITHTLFNGPWDSGNTWNREHVWPQSKSGGAYTNTKNSSTNGGADIHHVRATLTSANSSHGSDVYGTFDNPDCSKGDIVRICAYMYVHYSTQVGSASDSRMGNLLFSSVFKDKETILKWNEEDPVDIHETQRNEYAYKLQGNRNPFIDHPEWVKTILDGVSDW